MSNIYHYMDKQQRIVFWYPQDILAILTIFLIGDAIGHLFLSLMIGFSFMYLISKFRKTILKKLDTYSMSYWYFPSSKLIPVRSHIREYLG